MAVSPIPQGYHCVNIQLTFKHASKPLEFYRRAFGAELRSVIAGPGS